MNSPSLLARFANRFDAPDLRVAPTSTLTFAGIRIEVLAGLTVALALVPEAVAFAFVAGVGPLVGLYAAFIVGLVTALIGGRPGMISGATGALAVVMVSLVAQFPEGVGVQYLFLTVVLMGIIQIFVGIMRWGKFIRLVPHPVMLGFVNGLAIVIGKSQIGFFKTADGSWMASSQLILVLALVALTMAVIWGVPKLTNAIPAPLAGIAITAAVVIGFGLPVPKVGDLASISGGLPQFALPDVPLNWETLQIIAPYALILAAIGLIESLLTLNLVGEITGQRGGASQECIAQGAANTVTGFFGGMGGCAMIGQSMINVNSGGRTRIAGVAAALFLLLFILVASPLIEQIPLAALVGVMFMVVIGTFAWNSLKILFRVPKIDAMVIILVTIVTVMTDLAIAVVVGVIVSALAYAWQNATRIYSKAHTTPEGAKVYAVQGPLFFGSATGFIEMFDIQNDPALVIVDFADSRVADQSALQAIEAVAAKYQSAGKSIQLRHLTRDCHRLLTKAGHLMVDSDDDPDYAVAANYGVRTGILGGH
ncbi:sulfate permease, SulP family [Jannaschia faecimaris]|uniref:Sulfate permease, SulP family n=1 Tax=Jannaschia faecimaris TaxID=1244108 RepID=A0A1H3MKY3_9RHOB|nr:sulfate permease, SulP family [Jannaschia faecimaris]